MVEMKDVHRTSALTAARMVTLQTAFVELEINEHDETNFEIDASDIAYDDSWDNEQDDVRYDTVAMMATPITHNVEVEIDESDETTVIFRLSC